MDSKDRYKLKKLMKELRTVKGNHTELVSVYIPMGYELSKIVNHLQQEQGTATNIKSTGTRKNVIDALERMIQYLKNYTRTPPNGFAVFSGNASEREGQSDVRVWSIEPPLPLNVRIYRCDKEFVLEPLQDMIESKEMYGLVVMDRREANIAMLKGKSIIPMANTHSFVPGKFKTGGQSAARFARIRENMANDFYKKIAEYMKEQFLPIIGDIRGIIVGGPGPTKYSFVDSGYITDQVKQRIISIQDITYTDEFGLQELVDKSQDVLADAEIMDEKLLMQKFFDMLNKIPNKVGYGKDECKELIELAMVDVLLISEDVDDDTIEEFEKLADAKGTTLKIISTETREGVQLRDMGKYAAMLRYERR